MKLFFENHGSVEGFRTILKDLEADETVKSIIVMASDGNEFTKPELDPTLKIIKKPILGGIFPEVIFERESYEKGTVFIGLDHDIDVVPIQGISKDDLDVEKLAGPLFSNLETINTIFVFIDGLSSKIGNFIDNLYYLTGNNSNIIGGGAGSLSFEKKPVIISNKGLLYDAAILGFSKNTTEINVKHGWRELDGLYHVTESRGNTIISLDWEPAMDVYKRVVEFHSENKIEFDNFFEISKKYPFGISEITGENIIRDPISVDKNGYITCVGNIPENSFVHIMTGTKETLIASTQAAVHSIVDKAGNLGGEAVIFIDCISRKLFLEKEFSKEIDAVNMPGLPVFGALTLGEIANFGEKHLAFLNKTSVIGLLK